MIEIKRAALVRDSKVENVIVVSVEDGAVVDFAPEGYDVIVIPDDSPIAMLWTYVGVEFVPPPEEPVEE